MKIDPARHFNSSSPPAPYRILSRTLIILAVLAGIFFVAARSLEEIAHNYLLSHFQLTIPPGAFEPLELPNERFSASLSLNRATYDNYLSLTLSGGDTYKVSFTRGDDSDFILISTTGREDTDFLYLIPQAIAERGYEDITISPVRGDGIYWVQGMRTHADPDPADFPEHFVVDFEIKKLEISIEEQDFARLEAKRAEALALGILLTEEVDYVPAVVTGNGKRDRAEVRLKGDWTDHIAGDKWSFRIKMDDEPLWGMKKFSVHRPETRAGVSEYLIQKFYREQGGISLRYDFVDVFVNGEYWGVYALEEFFDKRLVEHASRREGPIIKVNERYLWERRAFFSPKIENWDLSMRSENRFIDFDVFAVNLTLENPALDRQTGYAITQLHKVVNGDAGVEAVFDLDMAARYFAALDLFNSCHGNIWHNMRYYFNPVTGLLEPISFDEVPKEGLCRSSSGRDDVLINPFFANPDFRAMYVDYLDKFLAEYDSFIARNSEDLAHVETIFERDGIPYDDFRTHLDELHFHMNTTLYDDLAFFTIETLPDGRLAIQKHNDSYLNVFIEEIRYKGEPLNIALSNFSNRFFIDREMIKETELALNQFEVVYRTLFDNHVRKQTVSDRELAYSFYVAGHIYGSHSKKGTPEQDHMHPPFAAALSGIAADERIELGVLTGDTVLIPSTGSYGNLKSALELTGKPYFITPGNHDLDGSGLFAAHFGSAYQSFIRGNELFVLLTPGSDYRLNNEQLQFLSNLVSQHQDVNNIFVFSHYLFWLDGSHFPWTQANGGPYQENRSNFWTDVLPLFYQYSGEIFFIAGDVGAFPEWASIAYERVGNAHFIASGMGGGLMDNYLFVHVFDDGSVEFDIQALNEDGLRGLGSLKDW